MADGISDLGRMYVWGLFMRKILVAISTGFSVGIVGYFTSDLELTMKLAIAALSAGTSYALFGWFFGRVLPNK